MVVKAVEMVRKIRDKHYEETKTFSVEEQIAFIKKKTYEFREKVKKGQPSKPNKKGQRADLQAY